jgi:hypothetical protein
MPDLLVVQPRCQAGCMLNRHVDGSSAQFWNSPGAVTPHLPRNYQTQSGLFESKHGHERQSLNRPNALTTARAENYYEVKHNE